MSVSVLMPALSPTMTEGTLARWLVKEGDSVKSGDVIAEIETDKATMEVEALDDGIVAKLAVAEGTQNVAVNALIAVLAEDGESVDDALAALAAVPASAPSTTPQTDAPAAASDAATSPVQPAVAPVPTARSDRVFASPLARRIAADAGLELARLSGTGPHGRIIRADVEEALASGASRSAVQPAAMLRTAPAAVPAEERFCLLYTSPSPRDGLLSRMPSSA